LQVLVLVAALLSAGSLDSLDASLQQMQEEIATLEEDQAAISTILEAMHQHLQTSRAYYNELALEEARILRQLGSISRAFTREDSLREELVESLSSYLVYIYSHRNLGGIGSFFVEEGLRSMLHRQAYVDYLASRAAEEVLMLSVSRDSLGHYRDSLEVLLVNVQELRQQMERIQENIYQEEARQAALRDRIMDRISLAAESLAVLEEQRISRASFVTRLSTGSSGSGSSAVMVEPDPDAYIVQNRGALSWPAGGQVIREFGIEVHQQYGTETTSDGITVTTQPLEDITASAPGVVIYAREFLSMGNMVILDHQDGYYTIYGHLSQVTVSPDDVLEPGEQVGRAGSVPGGRPGYYFEIRKGGDPVNPLEYLQ